MSSVLLTLGPVLYSAVDVDLTSLYFVVTLVTLLSSVVDAGFIGSLILAMLLIRILRNLFYSLISNFIITTGRFFLIACVLIVDWNYA